MYVSHLTLHAFRSYDALEVPLEPGVTAFIGSNGQGKTNIVEAVDYLSRLTSHRVASDAPLVKQGADQAVIRAAVVKEGRAALLEVEINPGRSNRARVNKAPLPRSRDLVGLVRTVLFSPEDLALVKGDPSDRRRFLDDLMVLRTPRLAGVKADYERVLQAAQRPAQERRRPTAGAVREHFDSTLAVWNDQLVRLGAELVAVRAALVDELGPLLAEAYAAVAKDAGRNEATLRYQPSVPLARPRDGPDRADGRGGLRRRARPPPRRGGAARDHPRRPAPRRARASRSARCRSRATPPTGSPGRSRWRCGWRPTTCCAPTATTRS